MEKLPCERAPAKINLRLKVVGRRDDGYHLLEMLNAPLELADILSISLGGVARNGRFVAGAVSNLPSIPAERNIAFRAAETFFKRIAYTEGFSIEIQKNIPLEAGLGGGSSDAAAVIRVLAKRFPQLSSSRDLVELGLSVGADVPYLLKPTTAWVEGVGEQVTPISMPELSGRECLLVIPSFSCSTSHIFAQYRASNPKAENKDERTNRNQPWADLVANDLLETVSHEHPQMRELLALLARVTGVVVGMSGSGSTIFALPRENRALPVHELQEIEPVAVALGARFIRTRVGDS